MKHRAKNLLSLLALGATLAAQQTAQTEAVSRTDGKPSTEAPKPVASRTEERMARQILESAEAEAGAFEPAPRSFLCYHAARGRMHLEKEKGREAMMRCFQSTLEIQRDDQIKQQIQGWIVTDLLKFGPATAEELLPQAEGRSKSRVRNMLINAYTKEKNFTRAAELVSEVRPEVEEFPYDATALLMRSLPEESAGLRNQLFLQALSDYKNRPPEKGNYRSEDMGTFVVRFARVVPKNVALEAIDEVLKKAKPDGTGPKYLQIVFSSEDRSAAFNSMYEMRLFQVLPALRVLDESKAEALLKENQSSKALLAKYPEGLQSIEPSYSAEPPDEKRKGGISMSVSDGDSPQRNRGEDQEIKIATMKKAEAIVKSADDNPRQAIAQAISLPFATPMHEEYRCRALAGIARNLWKKNPSAAKSALDEMVKQTQITDMHHEGKKKFLAEAAKMYLDLDDKDAALKTIKLGTSLAERLFEADKNAANPNLAMHPVWPSAAVWRVFIAEARRISPQAALEVVKGIDDPEIQLFQKIALANAWLGLPTGVVMTREQRKDGTNDTSISSSEN
jgi:hypothetical protein